MYKIIISEKPIYLRKEKQVLLKDAKIEITDCTQIKIKSTNQTFHISFLLNNEPHLMEIKNAESIDIQVENDKLIITHFECNVEYEVFPIDPENPDGPSIPIHD